MQKEKLTALGSVAAAIGASICCIGPLAAATLGAGSLVAASGLRTWRRLLLGVTFVLLGVAWYLRYRKARAEGCAERTACTARPGAKGGKVVLWFATGVAIGLAALPLYAGAVARLLHPEGAGPARSAGANVASMKVKIPDMDCAACAVNIERTLRKVEGVGRTEVVFKTKEAVIEYDPARISPERIFAVIDETGFKAERLEKKQ